MIGYHYLMCARYRLKTSLRHIAAALGVRPEDFEEFSEHPRLNIAISQRVPVIKFADGQRKGAIAEWGFRAPWDLSRRIFNAAGETAAVKPTFRESFRHRRCLIPADGFYEWPNRTPTLIRSADDRLFCFAGLWSEATTTLITCAPNGLMRPIHHRMPAILRDEDCDEWLNPQSPTDRLQALIASREWAGFVAEAIPPLKPDPANSPTAKP